MEAPATWKNLLASGSVRTHKTSPSELQDLRAVVERDLRDAALVELSADRRFATAYNAVLQLTKIALACAGYRVAGLGHHQTAFRALSLAMGNEVSKLGTYFDECRRKRNQVDYDVAHVISDAEVDGLLETAEDFRAKVESWVAAKYPNLAA